MGWLVFVPCSTRTVSHRITPTPGCSPYRKRNHLTAQMPSSPPPTKPSPEISLLASSPSQSNNRPLARLSQVTKHTMGSAGASATLFTADVVPSAPEDPLFGLVTAYKKDTSDKKIDLGIGAYRDDNAKPWILPVVKKVKNIEHPVLCE